MSHREFSAPRHRSLGFLPQKHISWHHGKVRSFPKDDSSKPLLLTTFLGYRLAWPTLRRKSIGQGSKWIRRKLWRLWPAWKLHHVDWGIMGYVETPQGLWTLKTIFAEHISDECKSSFSKNWHKSKKKAFTKYCKKWQDIDGKKQLGRDFSSMK